MVTDPPYNVDYGSAVRGKHESQSRQGSVIANDNLSDDEFYQFLLAFYKAAEKGLKKVRRFMCSTAQRKRSTLQRQ